jgi:hypothetical protein|tara:strand:- start:1829 stop:2200 length:372 start_codon:yes stop_codon:yes gene_type:complete
MATLADRVYDNGLTILDTEADKVLITSQEASNYAEANSTYALGNSTSLSIAAPSNRSAGGREVIVAALSDGSITGTGTATHYALVDVSATRLLATGSLTTSQQVASGNTFSLGSFTIGIPDPA